MILSTPRRRASRRAAFTLLEVLVVVAILVILASVASVATFSQLEKAKQSQAQLKAKTLANACDQYYMDSNNNTGTYPQSIQQLQSPPWGQTMTPFLKDPQNDILDPWGQPFQINPNFMLDNATPSVLVYTTSPRSHVTISQYGVGNNSRVQ
ncbi:MAG TPA: type II secretion system protein GspG [Urbifossiella sp.]|jgi:general secretion pathway protein G|nr:type II secretion system protein GspG [Urbifossiella sp.]